MVDPDGKFDKGVRMNIFTVNYPAKLCADGRILWLKARLARAEHMHIADVLQNRFTRHQGNCPECEKGWPYAVIYDRVCLTGYELEAEPGGVRVGARGPVGLE